MALEGALLFGEEVHHAGRDALGALAEDRDEGAEELARGEGHLEPGVLPFGERPREGKGHAAATEADAIDFD